MIKAVQENYGAFSAVRGFDLTLMDMAQLWNNPQSQADDIAYRYALQDLNSFVIHSDAIDYSQHNTHGELDLWNVNNPNGMTVEYIQDRAKMLWFKMQYDKKGLSYDERLNMGFGFPFPVDGDHYYADEESNLKLDIDGVNPDTFASHYIHFGTAGDDKLTGDALQDKLYGSLGSDRLDGGLGNDYMEGGKGYDSYQINGNDTVFDSDGNGFIHMGDYLLNKFETVDEKNSIWYSIDDNGNRTGFIAYKINENDLFVKGNGHSVTIQNFFQVAKKIGNSFDGLNIQLFSKEEQQSTLHETSDYLLWTGDIRPNTQIIHNDDGSITDTGIYDVNWTDHSQRNEKGEIINGIRQYGFADVIYGQVNVNNKIYGLSGNDALSGNNQDDLLLGGDGQDLITGGGGSDTIYGGSGDDYIYSNYTLKAPLRNTDEDTWSPSYPYIEITTSSPTWGVYIYEKIGLSENSYVEGVGSQVNDKQEEMGDLIYGGTGNDEIIASNNNDVIYGDKMDNETAETSNDGNDNIYGMAGDDLIYGGSGDDFIRGDGVSRVSSLAFLPVDQHGNDIIYAGDGNDTVYGNGGDDVIFGEDGDDFIGGDFNNETDNETESANLIDANGDDFIDGGSGNDTIQGGGADDVVMGGDDNDRIWGDYGHSELFHISGNDTLDGGDGKDEIYGGGGDDVIAGGNGDDFLVGDFSYNEKTTSLADINGNDFIDAGDGNDEILAGGGNDNILGGIGNDLIFGDYNNTIPQIFGNDYIDGQDGDDEIIGGGGDDSIVGGVGNDRIFGDFGANNPDAMQISGNDIIDGQDGDDVLFGSGGDDTIDGGDGNDIIYGDLGDEEEVSHIKGNDYLNGGNGHDTIYGNAGDDTLIAGKGNDQLIGGKGEDTYLFNSEDLRNEDVQYNVILDEDGKGAIVIDGVYLHEQNWKATAENRWETDNMLLEKREIDAYTFLIWQSKETNALISVQDYKNGDLNLNLPKYQPKPIITVNHEPIVNLILTEQTIKTNEEYSFRLPENLFVDPDGDDLTLSIENLPNWLHFDGHTLLGTPLIDDTGNLKLNIIATDPYGASTSQTLELNIEKPNQAPAVDQIIATQTITANQEWTFRLPENMFIDPDGDDLSFEINKLPNWLKFDGNTLSGTPTMDDLGSLKFEIIAKDPYGETASQTLEINIQTPPNAIMVSQNKIGSLKADLLIGNEANNTIRGNAGDDEVYGMDGNDTLYGGIGNDVLYGGNGADILNGGIGDDTLYGGSDNDTLNGDAGNDILKGGNGDDILNAGIGHDTLHGGVGNDILNGGLGNDIYIFNKGDGYDSINDLGGNDTLKIEANLGELWFAKEGKNLQISLIGSEDAITIKNAFSLLHRVENIETEDGKSLNYKEVNNIINTQNSFAYDSNLSGSLNDQMLEFNQTHGIL